MIHPTKTSNLNHMSEIKSALELALEKTADVQSDKGRVEAHEANQAGMRIAGRFLDEPKVDVKKELKAFDRKKATQVRAGFAKIMMSHLSLPTQEADLQRLDKVQAGLESVATDSKFVATVMEQVKQLLQQYLDTKNQVTEQLRQQFKGRLQQKEEQIAQQTGRRMKIDPASDPEFVQVLQQNIGQLQSQYGQVIDQAKEQLAKALQTE